MADLKISQLPNASTPLAGTEMLPIVQAGVTDKVTVDNLLARLTAAPPAIGTTTPSTGAFTTLSATGNVTLGDASTDTLNVGNGGIIKDASGNVGFGATPTGSLNLAFPIAGDKYIGKLASPSHQAGNACRLDLTIVDGAGYSGVSVRNVWDGTYSSQETVISTSYGGIRTTNDIFKVDKSGNALVIAPYGALGYGIGAGGTVTQATSKSTAVTLNKPCGQITMHNAALAGGAITGFVVTNSVCTPIDLQLIQISGGVASASSYSVWTAGGSSGAFTVFIQNLTGGSLSEAVVLNFVVIKGATS